MNVITNTVVAKLTVAIVAAAMLFTLATPAKAQTIEELQSQIEALMAQIAALTGTTDSTPAGACTFTRSLSDGSEGEDVRCLQQYLTPTYFNFAGGATGYFGPVTTAAVAAWQAAHGVSPAVGYFGPISQAKYNELMAAMPDDSDDDMDDDSDDSDDSDDMTLSGEASLDTTDLDDAEDDNLEEGTSDAEIGLFTVEFSNGDALITRLDIALAGTGDEQDPWDTFDEVSLWVDGDKIADFDASDEDEYLDEDNGEIRFSGLEIFAEEDEEVEIVIAASVANSVDGVSDGEAWTVDVLEMRFVDGDDVTTTESVSVGAVSFTIEEEGTDDELIVKTSSDDPDGTTLQLEDDSDSDWYTVFIFDLDTDDSVNDIELNSIPVSFTVSSGTVDFFVDDVELVVDGTTIDDVAWGADGATRIATFDVDGDVTIDAGDRIAVEVMVQFNSLNTLDEGTTIFAEVTSANADAIDAEGADDLDDSQTSGAAEGDLHTLRTQGVDVSIESADADVEVVDGGSDYATYTIEVEVTAFEQDVYLSTDSATSTTWTLETGAGAAVPAGSRIVSLSSTADEVGGYFEITEGSTETLTLEVTYTPGAGTSARLQLETLEFSSGQTDPDQTWTASPEEDYRTPVKTIVD